MSEHSIFVIDDDDAMRDSLLTLLRAEGLRARGFPSGAAFFARMPEAEAACVITDVRMPDIDGAEVVRRLSVEKGSAWPVIVITGHAEVPLAVQMMKDGVVDFIEKPFDPARLVETARTCLAALKDRVDRRQVVDQARGKLQTLTVRERQVFDALVQGRSNKQIALSLDLSPRTIEVFRAKVMTKMDAESLSGLVRIAIAADQDD